MNVYTWMVIFIFIPSIAVLAIDRWLQKRRYNRLVEEFIESLKEDLEYER